MVVGVGAALYYKLRLIGALGVGSIEAERGDDDQVATDFDAKFGDPDQACLNAYNKKGADRSRRPSKQRTLARLIRLSQRKERRPKPTPR